MLSFSCPQNQIRVHWKASTREEADIIFDQLQKNYPQIDFSSYKATDIGEYTEEYSCGCNFFVDELVELIKPW